jgi:hypothetical protein
MRRLVSWADNALLAVVVAAAGWWGYVHVLDNTAPPPASTPPGAARKATPPQMQPLLAGLAVKGRAPRTGYRRDLFGRGWVDVDRNGCDTRNDVLRRDLRDPVVRPGTNGCVVDRGELLDPYTGETIAFVKGNTTSTLVQIDHVVALSDAWQKGAQAWTTEQRTRFANDPENLLAVSQRANQAKKDGDAATWLPPNKAFRCEYVTRQVRIKATYGLWVTPAERDALDRQLRHCPP